MTNHRLLGPLVPLAIGTLALAGCGSSAKKSAAPATTSAPATTAVAASVKVATTSLGQVLVDAKGMTVYLFTKDTAGSGKSVCVAKCATTWPALTAAGAPAGAGGVDASKLGTITRDDGSTQVTYGGAPLYHFAKDSAPGDVNGENVGGIWFAVGVDGKPVLPAAGSTTTTT
jgi:predicted lipoprotein with Yx(FWY)xxD motif